VSKELEYGFADKAWSVVLGCDNTIPCWQNCWAKRTVARLASSPNAKVASAHADLVRVTSANAQMHGAPGLAWTGTVRINEAHLLDPLKWRKSAVIATGFHGDWGLLASEDKWRMFGVMAACPQHTFFPLTKHRIEETARWLGAVTVWPWINIGVSAMEQKDADAILPHIRRIAEMGWKVHCWHEPAIGPVDWRGWEFLSWLVVGGQSAGDAPFDLRWARDAIAWGNINHVPIKIKQIGLHPVDGLRDVSHLVTDRRGENWDSWPPGLRVRQMPEVRR
jgi:protein gp37